jgi:PPOX class probable F420-dependent enzyme
MSLTDEKCVAVSTYRKSGEPVSTATWIAPLDDGRMGFWTSSAAGKTKRLRNNPRVTLQPSDQRGRPKPGTEPTEGTAVVVTDGADFDAIQSRIKAKYGWQVPMTRFFNTLGHLGKGKHPYGNVVVVITLSQ